MGLNIGVDVDDTLVDIIVHYLEYFNKKNSTSYQLEDISSYFISDIITELSFDEMITSMRSFIKKEQYNLSLNNSAFEKLQELKLKGHSLHIITARGEELKDLTQNWFESLFGKYFFASFNFTFQTTSGCKSEIVNLLDIDIMIDDSSSYAKKIVEKTKAQVLLYDKPWNRNLSHKKLTRIYSFLEISIK